MNLCNYLQSHYDFHNIQLSIYSRFQQFFNDLFGSMQFRLVTGSLIVVASTSAHEMSPGETDINVARDFLAPGQLCRWWSNCARLVNPDLATTLANNPISPHWAACVIHNKWLSCRTRQAVVSEKGNYVLSSPAKVSSLKYFFETESPLCWPL